MDPAIDVDTLTLEILRKARGKKSQSQLSAKLGLSLNQVHRWESGSRQITWSQFVRLCLALKLPLDEVIRRHLQFSGSPEDSKLLIKHLIGHSTNKEFSSATGFQPSLVSKLKNGSSHLMLSQVLHILDRLHGVLPEFADDLFPHSPLDSLTSYRTGKLIKKQALMDNPAAGAFLAVSSLQISREQKEALWSHIRVTLNIDTPTHERMLMDLYASGWVNNDNGEIQVQKTRMDTRGDLVFSKQQRSYWMAQAQQILENATSMTAPHRFAYFIIAISDEADQKVADAYHKFIVRLKEIVSNDTSPSKHVRCFNIQDLSLGATDGKSD